MMVFGYLYWRAGLWRLHARASRALGRVACWWTGEHEVVVTMGSLTPIAHFARPGESPRPLPEPEEWAGSYCVRCGKTLAGSPHGERR